MLSARAATLTAILLGLSFVLPASDATARMMGAGQPAVKASRLSTISDGATSDLRDIANKVDQNRQQKQKTR